MFSIRLAALMIALLIIPSLAPPVVAVENSSKAVLIVLIFDDGCKTWCQKVRPIMGELKQQFGERIEVAEIDASQKTLKEAQAQAKELGVFPFLRDSAEWVPIVGIFSPQRKLIKELVGPKQKDTYVSAVEKALAIRN